MLCMYGLPALCAITSHLHIEEVFNWVGGLFVCTAGSNEVQLEHKPISDPAISCLP